MNDAALRETVLGFVAEVGIATRALPPDVNGFLPGLDIADGAILIDEARWGFPGDLLHEAGHVAVASPEERSQPKLDPTPGDEMAAIAWSYAALVHLNLPPEVVFHEHGYKGGSKALINAFANGGWVGMPLLAWYGMTVDPGRASRLGPKPFPHMLRWLR